MTFSDASVVLPGPCVWCDHNPACGVASWTSMEPGESFSTTHWFCHTDDHSCYREASEAVPANVALADYLQGREPNR